MAEEMVVLDEIKNTSGTVSLGETFRRTGTNKYGVNCTEEGQYNISKDSNSQYILPVKCLPRGE